VPENKGLGVRQGIDVLGSLLITGGLMLGIYAVVESSENGWGSARTIVPLAAGLALIAAFGVVEGRLRNPIMPLRILRVRGLISSSVVRGFLFVGMYGSFFLGTLYLEHVLHYDALRTGLAFLPMTVIIAILSTGITARLVRRFGPWRVLMPAMWSVIGGLVLWSQAGPQASYFPLVAGGLVLMGAGMGTGSVPLLTLAMSEVPAEDAGLASGIVNVSMQVAGAVGVAVLGTIATDRTRSLAAAHHSLADALTGGYHLAFIVAAAWVAAGIVAAVVLVRPKRSAAPAGAPPRLQPSAEQTKG
jgi:MFS family permease